MKRSWLITILICLLLLGGGGAVLFLPQVVPFDQCSDVYKKYARMDGVDATFIKDYKVNDTVCVDVTMLEAKTDSAWSMLQSDFKIPELDSVLLEFVVDKEHIVMSFIASMHIPDSQSLLDNSVLLFSYHQKAVCVFHALNERQQYEVLHHNYMEQIEK